MINCINMPHSQNIKNYRATGFTLIELSIVLVIIGLIIGGILVGRDLISAAAARAQISQIEKYDSAVNTFRNKYGGLPGDLQANLATQFGFLARGTAAGQGDGDGIIQGYGNGARGVFEAAGETIVFWVDLSTAGLIDGEFNAASETTLPSIDITGSAIASYLPQARIGNGNYVYVWNTNNIVSLANPYPDNWYGVSAVNDIPGTNLGKMTSSTAISPVQAYNIDKKMDDGLPLSGSVQAMGVSPNGVAGSPYWSVTSSNTDWGGVGIFNGVPPHGALAPSSISCMDNGGGTASIITYSISSTANGGNSPNCALSFKFQ